METTRDVEKAEDRGRLWAGGIMTMAPAARRPRVTWAGTVMAGFYDAAMGAGTVAAIAASRAPFGRGLELAERLGVYTPDLHSALRGRQSVWLHAASVGELQGLRGLVAPLRERFPGKALIVTTLTRTGRSLARDMPGVDAAVYFPLDSAGIVHRVMAQLRPTLFVFTETELWPRLLSECAVRRIPSILVSGRVSPGAVRRYAWVRAFMRQALARVTCCVQSEDDARRIIAVGAAPDRVTVTGSLKAEAPRDEDTHTRIASVFRRLEIGSRPLLVGASTHAGEERALVRAYGRARGARPEVLLLLAPRHPERFETVARDLDEARIGWIRFSEIEADPRAFPVDRQVILLDRLGLLRACFPFARLVFVGGTLVAKGGHNVMEPAGEGCGVVFGPHVESVSRHARALISKGAARQVRDAAELGRVLESLLSDDAVMAEMGECARRAAESERGALARHLAVIESVLDKVCDGEQGAVGVSLA